MTLFVMIIFILLLLIAVPVGLSVGITSIIPGLISDDFSVSGVYILRSALGGVNSYPLLAIPMFVLSGIIMSKGGVSKKLFEIFSFFIGKRTAGIPYAVVITCLFFGAISGSAPATVAAVGSMTIPLMLEMGYDKKFAVALVAVAGGLGVIIPPSIPFILYAQATGASVSDMFIAGIIPGILIALVLMGYAFYHCKKYGEDKEKINAIVGELHSRGLKNVLFSSFFALLTPVIILGCIYSGITSPTEAAVIAVFYSLIISVFVYKTLKLRDLPDVFREAVRTFCPILFILAGSVAFSRILTLLHVPQTVSIWMTGSFTTKFTILLVINLLLLVVGMVMDTSPAILIIAPILAPVAQTFGVDPVQFGIIMVVNLAIGFVTPPIGINLFVASSMSKIPVMEIAKKAVPMILLFFIVLLMITYIPQISLLLV